MPADDVLTEVELDALMAGAVDHATAATNVRAFDFMAREQSLLNQFTALVGLHERHAEQLGLALGNLFSNKFRVTPRNRRLANWGELLASIPDPVAVTTQTLLPLPGHCHVVCEAPLLSQLVNDYFGGVRGLPHPDSGRGTLTPSELRLAERVAELVVASLVSAWSDKLPLEPGSANTVPHADVLAALPEREKALCLSFDVTCGALESELSLLLPFAALEPWKERFKAPRRLPTESATTQGWQAQLRRVLPSVSVEVAVRLGSRECSLADVLAIGVGSVIELAVPEDVELCIEGVSLGRGRYGAHEGRKAVRITSLSGPSRPSQRKG